MNLNWYAAEQCFKIIKDMNSLIWNGYYVNTRAVLAANKNERLQPFLLYPTNFSLHKPSLLIAFMIYLFSYWNKLSLGLRKKPEDHYDNWNHLFEYVTLIRLKTLSAICSRGKDD